VLPKKKVSGKGTCAAGFHGAGKDRHKHVTFLYGHIIHTTIYHNHFSIYTELDAYGVLTDTLVHLILTPRLMVCILLITKKKKKEARC
jgi:uncharacterized membrane protein